MNKCLPCDKKKLCSMKLVGAVRGGKLDRLDGYEFGS